MLLCLPVQLLVTALSFNTKRDPIQYRVHVNGMRGTSTVTRYMSSRLVVADRETVQTSDLQGFSHFAIEDNVAIGLDLAKLLKVPRDTAITAMQSATSDPGAFSIQFLRFDNHQIA